MPRSRRYMREATAVFGDGEMLEVVAAGLGHLPAVVQDMVTREMCILAVGWSTAGWATNRRLLGPDGEPRPYTIVLDGASRDPVKLQRVLYHEVGHCWYRVATCEPALSAAGEIALRLLAAEEGWHRALAAFDEEERQTDALGLAWEAAAAHEGGAS